MTQLIKNRKIKAYTCYKDNILERVIKYKKKVIKVKTSQQCIKYKKKFIKIQNQKYIKTS